MTHLVNVVPDWVAYYMPVVTFPPGTFAGTRPLRLLRCLVCWGLVDGDSLQGHYGHHVREGHLIP